MLAVYLVTGLYFSSSNYLFKVLKIGKLVICDNTLITNMSWWHRDIFAIERLVPDCYA